MDLAHIRSILIRIISIISNIYIMHILTIRMRRREGWGVRSGWGAGSWVAGVVGLGVVVREGVVRGHGVVVLGLAEGLAGWVFEDFGAGELGLEPRNLQDTIHCLDTSPHHHQALSLPHTLFAFFQGLIIFLLLGTRALFAAFLSFFPHSTKTERSYPSIIIIIIIIKPSLSGPSTSSILII
jgi:hypothetical protein